MAKITDCFSNEIELGSLVGFVSNGRIRAGKVIELTQKFTFDDRRQTMLRIKKNGGGISRTRYPERCMLLKSESDAAKFQGLVPLGQYAQQV